MKAMHANKQSALPTFAALRADFPILQQTNRGRPLIYFDSAASAQKPAQVIDAMRDFYMHDYANINRGIYELSERATSLYELGRVQAQQLLNAASAQEIVYTRSTTDGINLLAHCLGQNYLQAGDEIILSQMEHHANIVPWYLLQQTLGIVIKVTNVLADGRLDIEHYQSLFTARTKLVSLTHVSNVLGIINPIKELTRIAHEHKVPMLVDGAQAIAHVPVDVQDIDCDFYIFSGHKLYGPTGTGILYAKQSWLAQLPPYQGGGDMIASVAFTKITFAQGPRRFEAGTGNLAGVIGLSAAIDYVRAVGMPAIMQHDQQLLAYAVDKLAQIPGLTIIGEHPDKVGVLSFTLQNIHPHDVGTVLDHAGIAVRASHHCAMPLMQHFKIPATVRISFGLYNQIAEIDVLIETLWQAKRLLG